MTYEEKKLAIIAWFHKNNLWENFVYNLFKLRPHFDPFVEEELNEFLITKAFVWMMTAEGTEFWNNVDNKYKTFYKDCIMKEEKQKSIKIEVPEGYEIDREKSTFENIVFKKKEAKPWRKETHNVDGYYITGLSAIKPVSDIRWMSTELNVFATKKQAKSALAMAQISQIMANDPRFGGPITDEEWKDFSVDKYIITRYNNNIKTSPAKRLYFFLAFHTLKQRELFLQENEDLIKYYLMLD